MLHYIHKVNHTGDHMSHDKRKHIYTLTIIAKDTGRIAEIQTYSSKKYAEERLAHLEEIFFGRENGDSNRKLFAITLSTSRLRRKARNMGAL